MPEINAQNINQNYDILFENNLKDIKKIRCGKKPKNQN